MEQLPRSNWLQNYTYTQMKGGRDAKFVQPGKREPHRLSLVT